MRMYQTVMGETVNLTLKLITSWTGCLEKKLTGNNGMMQDNKQSIIQW